jgi:uncharacterized phage protein (TIGR02218 family)
VKNIPAPLLGHKRLSATTLCKLMRVEAKDGSVYGFTDLDIEVTYDDGSGAVTYICSDGFMPSAIANEAGLSVENADLTGIVAQVSTDIDKDTIRSGALDYAFVKIYQVNYEDLSQGHEWIGYGNLGEVTYQDGQYVAEYRSRAQVLKQTNVCALYSLTCRAEYGDARCGATLVWANGTVMAPGTEQNLSFTGDTPAQADGYYVPGIVEWLTGANAGRSMEVSGYTAGGLVTLMLPLYYPIAAGDTYRIRIDCPKTPEACADPLRDRWPLFFRGEPNIPVGDAVQTPGAQQ